MPVIKLTSRPKKSVVVFCDEASHNRERYFVVGGVYFGLKESVDTVSAVQKAEQHLENVKERNGYLGRVKWAKVPSKHGTLFDGYKAFVDEFLELAFVQFKCLVVDTRKYPLGNRVRWEGDALVGFLKFYCVFLADGLMQRHPGYYYDIVVDEFGFRDGNDCSDLERTVELRYIRKVNPPTALSHCSVRAGHEEESSLLQLADLLVGAVGFAWNGGLTRKSSRAQTRQELLEHLEQKLQIKLGQGTQRSKQKFNIWVFNAP